jgi:flagellar assembly factor FliW
MLAYNENRAVIMDTKLAFNNSEFIEVKNRFGTFHVDISKAIYFPKGIYGFPEDLHFALLNFNSDNPMLEGFKILQCLNDHSVAFPVIPGGYKNSFISEEDMKECIDLVEVKEENFSMLFIASSQKQGEGFFRIFMNTKAPIIIDTSLQMAVQHIFTNNKYSVSQPLDATKTN